MRHAALLTLLGACAHPVAPSVAVEAPTPAATPTPEESRSELYADAAHAKRHESIAMLEEMLGIAPIPGQDDHLD